MSGYRPLLLIRADAGPHIGSGHLMRCLALGQAWQRLGGRVLLATAALPAGLESTINAAGFQIAPVDETLPNESAASSLRTYAAQCGADWLVIDGYQFNADFIDAVNQPPRDYRLLWIDDSQCPSPVQVDAVLNQNVFASPECYSRIDPAHRWTGTQFALLRDEFRAAVDDSANRIARQPTPGALRILVTMGGADPTNMTLTVLCALDTLPTGLLELNVVLGAACPHAQSIATFAASSRHPIRIQQHVTRMADLMQQCDLAVAAAGSTSYELAALGVPMLLIVTADNQQPVAEGLAVAGAAINLQRFGPADRDRLRSEILGWQQPSSMRWQSLAAGARRLVDARGSDRVSENLMLQTLSSRPATMDDADKLYRWQREASVRAASFSAGPADWNAHSQWLQRSLRDSQVAIELFHFRSGPAVGCIRWSRNERRATVSVLIGEQYRGRRLARPMLSQSIERLRRQQQEIDTIDAWIKPTNTASLRTFAGLGFQRTEQTQINSQPAELWQLPLRVNPPAWLVSECGVPETHGSPT